MTSGNNQGWIKLNRSILDSAIFKDSEIYHIYSYLLLKANHKDNEFIFNGKNEICKRGQLITGILQISNDTGINRGKVDRTLKYLETVKQIVKQSNSKFSLITMLTYEDELESVNQNMKPVGNEYEASVNKQEGKESINNITDFQKIIQEDNLSIHSDLLKIFAYYFLLGFSTERENIKGLILGMIQKCQDTFGRSTDNGELRTGIMLNVATEWYNYWIASKKKVKNHNQSLSNWIKNYLKFNK